jgi:hypothetical protein
VSFADIRRKTHEAANGSDRSDDTKCAALSCPCRASVKLESMGWACSTHAWAHAHLWPATTDALLTHRWLIDFIDQIGRIERMRDPKQPDWRSHATAFWKGVDDFCLPHEHEGFMSYQNRMRSELAYRCGVLGRPHPRLPRTQEAPRARFPWKEVSE